MKRLILGLIFSLTAAALAGALVPQYINYQGILRDSSGNLEDGTFSMVFKIYDAETAGTAVFNAAGSTTSVSVSNGLYNVRLGPVDSSVFDGSDRWLEVTVGSDTLSPRLRINSVAYAIAADVAETATNANAVNGLSASSEATAGELLALDSNLQLKGMSVSAEASGNDYALYVDGGKIGIKTGANMIVGTGSLGGGSPSATINNTAITANSIIFITPRRDGTVGGTNAWLKVKSISNGQFVVTTYDESTGNTNELFFDYLIIN